MKKPFAAFTIVKDEPVNLPIWLKHYRRTFAGRLGTYRYMDMDVTIAEALKTAQQL